MYSFLYALYDMTQSRTRVRCTIVSSRYGNSSQVSHLGLASCKSSSFWLGAGGSFGKELSLPWAKNLQVVLAHSSMSSRDQQAPPLRLSPLTRKDPPSRVFGSPVPALTRLLGFSSLSHLSSQHLSYPGTRALTNHQSCLLCQLILLFHFHFFSLSFD